jgi:hypothetical protein
MGNIQFQCPTEFEQSPTSRFSCVVKCPSNKGYEVRQVNGMTGCVYKAFPDRFVSLKPTPTLNVPIEKGKPVPPAPSFESLKETNLELYNRYKEEYERFGKEFAIVDEEIGRRRKIQDAFQQLQIAENARDTAPEAYQEARNRYYTLTRGESWLQEERERLARVDVAPVINEYVGQYDDMKRRANQQQRTIDVVNAVKDKLLSVQDELSTSVNAFSRQINGLKNMINLERRKQEEKQTKSYEWIGLFLNIVLTIVIVIAVISLVRVVLRRQSTASTPLSQPYRYR